MKRGIDALAGSRFDVLVIGGGVVGACVARDAALRGLDVALVERADFGGGASANCLKIVHGGLRYLQSLDVRRMRASIGERSAWLRVAPHLVEPVPFLLPTYGRGLQRRTVLRFALAVHDALARDRNRGVALERRLPAGRMLTCAEALDLVPDLAAPGLTGAALVYDAQMYSPERLVLEIVGDAHAAGAVVANYVEFEGPLVRAGRLVGGRLRDRLDGCRIELRARLVVNAAGSAAPGLATRLTGRAAGGRRALPPFSLALNVVVPGLGHEVGFAVGGGGGRRLFVAPWRGRTLIGTGHYGSAGDPRGPEAERCVDRFLAEIGRALPGRPSARDDVLLVHRGLVPLERAARAGEPPLLRRHRVLDHAADGVPEAVSVVAEKFTTARRIAEHVVDLLFRKLDRPSPPCVTADVPLPGAPRSPERLLEDSLRRFGGRIGRDALEHLTRMYGRRYERVLRAGGAGTGTAADRVDVLELQFLHATRDEMACRVDDLLWRRTEIGPRGLRSPAAAALAARVLESAAAAPAAGVSPSARPEPGARRPPVSEAA